MAEVGILGQVAKVPRIDKRLDEARRLGFKKAYTSLVNKDEKKKLGDLTLLELTDLNDLAVKLR